jgi:enoyl-CoA hydratase
MVESILLQERRESALILTLNRPGDGNLMNFAMLTALRDAIAAADADNAVVAVVLTGADPIFCLGDDGEDMRSADPEVRRAITEAIFTRPNIWPSISKPVIGAINGPCERGGLEIALQCDFLIASERASFRDVHLKGGVVPAWGLTVTLPAAVGRAMATRMCLTQRSIDAHQALIAGLVTEVTAHAELWPSVMGVVADIADNDRAAMISLLRTLRAGGPMADAPSLDLEFDAHRDLLTRTGRFPAVLKVLEQVHRSSNGQAGSM